MATVTAPEISTACKKLRQGPARSSPVFVECPPHCAGATTLCAARGRACSVAHSGLIFGENMTGKYLLFGFILS